MDYYADELRKQYPLDDLIARARTSFAIRTGRSGPGWFMHSLGHDDRATEEIQKAIAEAAGGADLTTAISATHRDQIQTYVSDARKHFYLDDNGIPKYSREQLAQD